MVYPRAGEKTDVEILSLVEKIERGEKTIHYGARCLSVPYTTIISRIYRGSTIKEAFTKPIEKRNKMPGNAAWHALGD